MVPSKRNLKSLIEGTGQATLWRLNIPVVVVHPDQNPQFCSESLRIFHTLKQGPEHPKYMAQE